EHRALPSRRPFDSRPGDRGLGAAGPRGLHSSRRRRGARERLGAGPVSNGGAPAYRGELRLHRRSGSAAPRMGGGSATRYPARGQHRHARRPVRQQPSREADQLGRDPSPAGPLAAAALRVPERQRGRQAEGARRTGDRDHGPGRAHRAPRPTRGVRVSLELQFVLLLWGTLVGLDLVSVPQMMIARPIVAGPIAGAMLGDLGAGLQLGVLFELFQYDVLPMGATRYPEYGPATVAAVSAAHGAAGAPGCHAAGHRCRGRRARSRDGGDTPRGGSRGEPGVVRCRGARRYRAGLAAVTRARRPPLGRSLLRLFTVQGSWNYERLQGIGVGVAEEPLLRDLRAGENGAAYR